MGGTVFGLSVRCVAPARGDSDCGSAYRDFGLADTSILVPPAHDEDGARTISLVTWRGLCYDVPMSTRPKSVLLLHESYLAVLQRVDGTRMFQRLWFRFGTKKMDIVRGGELSCALFVSSILHQFYLLPEVHATVLGTVADMKKNGWKKIRSVRPGAVLRWAAVQYPDRTAHEHIGFALSKTTAVSNSTSKKVPHRHHISYGARGSQSYRPVTEIWWHPKLGR